MFIVNNVVVDQRFCGPSDSGNGGYTAGLMASHLPFSPEITLRKPPPLNRPLRLFVDGESARLMDEDTLIAEAEKAEPFTLDIPEPVPFTEAESAAKNFYGFEHSPFPNCFVCGHLRKAGEGLKIHPGRVGEQVVAAPWIPFAELESTDGMVQEKFIWAALDCPGAWSLIDHDQVVVLGRIKANIIKPIKIGDECVVLGWVIKQEGRKNWTGTSVFNSDKKICAYAKAIWISIK